MDINLIMPMGGSGTRFGNTGFNVPKPLIMIYGKPFFYWATQSVAKFVNLTTLTFVVLQSHIDQYHLDQQILSFYPNANIIALPSVLPGALLTCIEGVNSINNDRPILFNDCDHLFICKSFYDYCNKERNVDCEGGLLTFDSNDPCYSYVGYDEEKVFKETKEKCVISTDAICGAYYFNSKQAFLNASKEYLDNCPYNEYFVSGVYNFFENKKSIRTFRTDVHVSFGTPEEFYKAQEDLTYKELL